MTNNPPIPEQVVEKTALSDEEKSRKKADKLARSYLLQGLTNEIYTSIDSHKTAKSMWDEIEKQMRGTKVGERIKVANVLTNFDGFKAREGELLESTNHRYCNLLNNLRKNGIYKSDMEINLKFLNNLRPEWTQFTLNLAQIKDMAELNIHVLYESLKLIHY